MMRPAIARPMSRGCATCFAGCDSMNSSRAVCCSFPAPASMPSATANGSTRIRPPSRPASPGRSCSRPSNWPSAAACRPPACAWAGCTTRVAPGCRTRCVPACRSSAIRRSTATAFTATMPPRFPSCCRRTPAAPRCSPATWGRRRAGAAARGGRLAARAAGCHPLGRAGMTRRAGSKRCSNARARALGWKPRFASYRDGYASLGRNRH